MKPQAALCDVIFVKVAKNPTDENIENVFQVNKTVFTGFGISDRNCDKLKDIIKMMADVGGQYIDHDPKLVCGEFTGSELKLIFEFSWKYVTIRDSTQNYFYKNIRGDVVNTRGHVCDIIAVRVTFGNKYAPIIIPYKEVHNIKRHVDTFTQQLDEYKETVYYQLSDRLSDKPIADQQPILFFYEGVNLLHD